MNSVYRTTALWESLDDTLADMDGVIGKKVAEKVKLQYDRSTLHVLQNDVTNKIQLKANCKCFNNPFPVYKYVLTDAVFRMSGDDVHVDRVDIVGVDSKEAKKPQQ